MTFDEFLNNKNKPVIKNWFSYGFIGDTPELVKYVYENAGFWAWASDIKDGIIDSSNFKTFRESTLEEVKEQLEINEKLDVTLSTKIQEKYFKLRKDFE